MVSPVLRPLTLLGFLGRSLDLLHPRLGHEVGDVLLKVVDACAHLVEWRQLRNQRVNISPETTCLWTGGGGVMQV